MTRQQYLLLLVAVLLLLRFAVVPAFEWLDSELEDVIAEGNKSAKQEMLLQSKAPLEAQLAEIDSFLEDATKYAFKADSVQAATLVIQSMIEKEAQKHEVKINRIAWVEPDGEENKYHRIEIYIKAHPADWVALQSDLEGKSWLLLERMNFFYSRRTGDSSLIGTISGTLAYNLNLWIEDDKDN